MTLIRRSSTAVPIALVLTLAAGSALAGTTGTEFQTMYTTLLNWATGFLGKSIAIAAFILGAGVLLTLAGELKVPVRFIGIGEQAADMDVFDATEFAAALTGTAPPGTRPAA